MHPYELGHIDESLTDAKTPATRKRAADAPAPKRPLNAGQPAVGASDPRPAERRNARQAGFRITISTRDARHHRSTCSLVKEQAARSMASPPQLETGNYKPEVASQRDSGFQFLVSRWSRPGSNRQPLACKASALPIELRPRRFEPKPPSSLGPSHAQPQPRGPQPPAFSRNASKSTKAPISAKAPQFITFSLGRSRLSIPWARVDSNHWPRPYQGRALTN